MLFLSTAHWPPIPLENKCVYTTAFSCMKVSWDTLSPLEKSLWLCETARCRAPRLTPKVYSDTFPFGHDQSWRSQTQICSENEPLWWRGGLCLVWTFISCPIHPDCSLMISMISVYPLLIFSSHSLVRCRMCKAQCTTVYSWLNV